MINPRPHTSAASLGVEIGKDVHGSRYEVKGYLEAEPPGELELAVALPLDVSTESSPLQEKQEDHEKPMAPNHSHHVVTKHAGKQDERQHTRRHHAQVPHGLGDVARQDHVSSLPRYPVIGSEGEDGVEDRDRADSQGSEDGGVHGVQGGGGGGEGHHGGVQVDDKVRGGA